MSDILIFFNIFLLEVILSIDNAAVLATMVKRLPEHQQKKALTYGLVGAYLFRGLALLFAALLIKVMWLKVVGGIYLMYLAWRALYGTPTQSTIGVKAVSFWGTVVMIELMDLVFSIDNVFAAVAFTDNLWLICGGVFVGIVSMRFASVGFIKILEEIPILEKIAYWVIGLLGLRLILSFWLKDLNTELIDGLFSTLTLGAFLVPIIYKKFNK
jgi:YkoY family integral membrane protein